MYETSSINKFKEEKTREQDNKKRREVLQRICAPNKGNKRVKLK
jgi:hypothetical protein